MTVILPIFGTLCIVNLGGIIAKINIIRAKILIIAIIITIIAIIYKKNIIIFVAKKNFCSNKHLYDE